MKAWISSHFKRGISMSIDTMSHKQAKRTNAVERYVLGELTQEERAAFESHYFDCGDCFKRVKMETQFLRHARQVLGPEPEAEPKPESWLFSMMGDLRRPAPAFASAMLLCAVGVGAYQQSVIADSRRPRVESRVVFHGQPRGGTGAGQDAKIISVSRKAGLSLTVEFTPTSEYSSYAVRILSESGSTRYSVPLPGTSFIDGCTISVSADALKAGRYSIVVEGSTRNGGKDEMAGGVFELKFVD
jgi:hypothetical protein